MHGLMTVCHATRKGGHNGSHWPKHKRASALLGCFCALLDRDGLAVTMQLKMGSTRALACSDRRHAGRNKSGIRSLTGDSFGRLLVLGEGAKLGTRGRVRSPFN